MKLIILIISSILFLCCSNSSSIGSELESTSGKIDRNSIPEIARFLISPFWTDSPGGEFQITMGFFPDKILIIGYKEYNRDDYLKKIGLWSIDSSNLYFNEKFIVNLKENHKYNEATDRITISDKHYIIANLKNITSSSIVNENGKSVLKLRFVNIDEKNPNGSVFFGLDSIPFSKLPDSDFRKLQHLINSPKDLLYAIYKPVQDQR